jgi:tRNA 2-thiouridine synthesizing protein D
MATITLGIMDPPYESANTPTAFRIVESAIRKGHNVYVFCYEGATALGYAGQKQHPNAVHGHSVEQEDHPNPKDWVTALLALAKQKQVKLVWCNCGLCVDERGVENQVEGAGRGSPVDAWKYFENSDGSLLIGTE